jgi:hypothetical protein
MDSLAAFFVAWEKDSRISIGFGTPAWASEFSVETEARDGNRTADLVIARIVDVLQIERREKAAPKMRGIEALEDFFRAVGEAAVT